MLSIGDFDWPTDLNITNQKHCYRRLSLSHVCHLLTTGAILQKRIVKNNSLLFCVIAPHLTTTFSPAVLYYDKCLKLMAIFGFFLTNSSKNYHGKRIVAFHRGNSCSDMLLFLCLFCTEIISKIDLKSSTTFHRNLFNKKWALFDLKDIASILPAAFCCFGF